MLARSLLVVGLLGALMFVLWRHQRHDSSPASEASGSNEAPAAESNHSRGAANAITGPNRAIRKVTPDQRAAIADAIAKAQAARAARPEPKPDGRQLLDNFSTHFMEALQQVGPYLGDCYDAETRKHMTSVMAHMNLTSDPDVGTLIDPDTMTDGNDHPLDPSVAECLRTTFESIELPPMGVGGSVTFSFPIAHDIDLAHDAGL